MVNVRGLDMTEMGLLAAIPAVVSIFTMLLSGYVLDRIPAGKDRIIASVFGVLVAFFLYLMGSSGSIATFITYMTIVTAMAGFISTLIISKSLKPCPNL